MTCQRNWLYLESIFSAPDIQRQLPAEAKMFLTVDKSWKEVMRKVHRLPNALRAATQPGKWPVASYHRGEDKYWPGIFNLLEFQLDNWATFTLLWRLNLSNTNSTSHLCKVMLYTVSYLCQVCWRYFRTITPSWIRFRSVWKLIWSLNVLSFQGKSWSQLIMFPYSCRMETECSLTTRGTHFNKTL